MFLDVQMPEACDNENNSYQQEACTQEQDEECEESISREKTFSTKAVSTPYPSQKSASQVHHPREKKEQRWKRHAQKRVNTA